QRIHRFASSASSQGRQQDKTGDERHESRRTSLAPLPTVESRHVQSRSRSDAAAMVLVELETHLWSDTPLGYTRPSRRDAPDPSSDCSGSCAQATSAPFDESQAPAFQTR